MRINEQKDEILNSWKEIAQYLGRGVRTVQRWESELGMPVRRPRAKSRSAVVAFKEEIDRWLVRIPSNVLATDGPLEAIQGYSSGPCSVCNTHVLLVEDVLKDVETCVTVLRRQGARRIEVLNNVSAAIQRLLDINEGRQAKPNLMILDLGLSAESGFDILRRWRALPALRDMKIVVWTSWAESPEAICGSFGIQKLVPKWMGERGLEEALIYLSASAIAA